MKHIGLCIYGNPWTKVARLKSWHGNIRMKTFQHFVWLSSRLLRAAAVPVTAGSRRESKEFSPMLFYNTSRFRGEKFPLETHWHRRVASIATQLRENARPCGKIYARSRYDVAQTRAVLVIVRSAAQNGVREREREKGGSFATKIPSR